LIELVIACLLVAAVAGLVLPTVSWIMTERRSALQRQAAGEELANLMDHLTRQTWEEITQQQAEQLGLAPEIERQLPEARLAVSVDSDQKAKRIHLSLSWSDRAGRSVGPVRLTTWVYRRAAPNGVRTRDTDKGEISPERNPARETPSL
jgi:type II secretory pathway pseudopilin PulG